MRATSLVAVLVATAALAPPPALAQVSDPIAHDGVVTDRDGGKNKFLDRKALPDSHDDEEARRPKDECPANLRLRWMTEVTSSVYSTPVIADLFSDGHKEIIVPSFVHYLEVLEGEDGAKAGGEWPAFHKSTAHASPLVHDSGAGAHILLPTYDGEVLFFDDSGARLAKTLRVPPLRVRRDWHVGLDPDHVDHSHPDVGDDAEDPANFRSGFRAPDIPQENPPPDATAGLEAQRRRAASDSDSDSSAGRPRRRRLLEDAAGADPGDHTLTEEAAETFAVFDDFNDEDDYDEVVGGAHFGEVVDGEGARDERDDREADREFWAGTDGDDEADDEAEAEAEDEEVAQTEAHDVGGIPHGDARQGAGRSGTPDEVAARGGTSAGATTRPGVFSPAAREHRRAGWEDENHVRRAPSPKERDAAGASHVLVDAHLLCTPAIADLDGDGREELVLAVSYFFDREYYDNPAHAGELPAGIDMGKYVASGVYVVDLETLKMRWHTHLDLSTDSVTFRAYAYSAPTVVDLDRDGKMEIALGTSVGFLYVLRHDGSTARGWPKQMGEIQAQVAVADLDGDGYQELVAADTRGSVAAFRPDGEELWERHLASLIAQGATIGDVDGDGELEVVVGTSSGAIHALRGSTGKTMAPFPFYTGGRVMSPALLTKLRPNAPGLSLVTISFDGFLYVIDGASACVDVVDIGETSYSMPLVDDINGDGRMDLVVATMNGVVYAFESGDAPYDPMHAWTSQVHAVNNFVARAGTYGVRAKDRGYHDVRGTKIVVPFEIVDARRRREDGTSVRHGPYDVQVTVTAPGFARSVSGTFEEPGDYALSTEIPNWRARGRVTVRVSDRSKIFAEDAYSVSFHMRFYRALKWILVVPFTLMAAALIHTSAEGNALPTFAGTTFRGGLEGGHGGKLA